MRTFLVAVVGAAVFAAAAAQPTIDRTAECGVANRRSRIVDGEDTEVDEYPWQAVVVKKDSPTDFVVSGSLINDRFVLTNAYNMDIADVTAADIRVILGAHKLSELSAGTQHAVDKIMPHAGYNYDDWWKSTDVALLRLASPVSTMPVCLPLVGPGTPRQRNVDDEVEVDGSGATEDEGDLVDQLLELAGTVWSNNDCKIEEHGAELVDLGDDMLFANGDVDKGVCGCGVSIITLEGDRYTLIGMTFPVSCAEDLVSWATSIYAKMTVMLSWIEESMNEAILELI